MSSENKYVPPDQLGAQPPASAPAPAAGYTPPGAAGPGASGYTPPSAGAPAEPAHGYAPPSASAPPASAPSASAPAASAPSAHGYTPPSVSTAPAAPTASPREAPHETPHVTFPPASAPTPVEPPAPPARRISPVALALGAIVALAAVGLIVAFLLGAFEPKMSHLPAKVNSYARETTTQKTSATEYDATTYRAGTGDVYQASILKNAPDPSVAFNKATADSRFQLDKVYCTGVSKAGKGGTCSVLLATGSAAVVDGSTRHTVQDIAQFTAALAAAIK